MQGKVAFLQASGLTQAPVVTLVEKHPDILSRASEPVGELLRAVDDIFDCAQDMDTIANVVLSCKSARLFSQPSAALQHKFSYFCNCVGVNDREMTRAWKNGVFTVRPADVDIRLSSLAAQLGATMDEAKGVVRRMPVVCSLLPETVGLHVTQMLGLGFSHGQVKSLCLRQPILLTFSYTSNVRLAKWGFLTCVLRLSHDDFVAYPHLLMSSLPNKVGPRWEYLRQLRLHGEIAFTGPRDVINSLASMSDVQFTARYRPRAPQMHVYDKHFQKQWQKRWELLLVDQQLSIQYIADNPDVLHISLSL